MQTFRYERSRALVVVAVALMGAMVPATPALADATEPAVPTPAVSSISPTSGTVLGGAIVTITGTSFTGTTAVAFGRTPATRFTVVSDRAITATTPVLDAGTYAISVTTAAGTTVAAATFTVRTLEDEVLRLVNQARAARRTCGSTSYKAVPALRVDRTLAKVAAAHSADMAVHSYFSHNSRNGASPFDRMKAAGFRYSSAGENIAAGYRTPASVVSAWLKSPGHCRNIMKKSYTRIGVGYATGGYYGTYWTQDFGRPR